MGRVNRRVVMRWGTYCLLALGVLLSAAAAKASDIYIGQNPAGAGNGADCANAYPEKWFNTPSSWGNSAAQIGPGTTVHLCGTFTGNANTTELTFLGSGTAGNVITLKFETGAILTSPAWSANGAIALNGQSYILIDGGTNGTIQNTANGTSGNTGCLNGSCSISQDSRGIFNGGSGGHDLEIRNLVIHHIYIRTPNSTDVTNGAHSGGIGLGNVGNNILIHNNQVSYSNCNIEVDAMTTGTTTGWKIYNNTVHEANWNIEFGGHGTGSSLSGTLVFGNDVSGAEQWDTTADTFHHDGIFTFSVPSGMTQTNTFIYNNYFHGNWGFNVTSPLYLDNDGVGYGDVMDGNYVFNNVFDGTGQSAHTANGQFYVFGTSNTYVFNNTFVGNGAAGGKNDSGGAANVQAGATNYNFQNNIVVAFEAVIAVQDTSTLGTIDRNDYYNLVAANCCAFFNYHGTWYNSIAAWQAAGHGDRNSSTSDPKLSSGFVPQAGSSAIGLGTNLTQLGILALNSDRAAVPRPLIGAWDAGAYVSGSSGLSNAPNAPTGLVAIVH